MSFDDPNDVRFRPDDDCPIFSQSLEDHIVAVSRGTQPNAGRFCGNCYTPIARDTEMCPHCREDTRSGRAPLDAVPSEMLEILRKQRAIESKWVNGFAYLGIIIAAVTGIAIVLWVPFFRDRLIWATLFYGVYLLIGSRVLPAILGGYYGDRIGFEKARAETRAAWAEWVTERDQPRVSPSQSSTTKA